MNIIQKITLLGGLAGSLWGQQVVAQKASSADETFRINGKEMTIQRSLRSSGYTLDLQGVRQSGNQYLMKFRQGDNVMMMTAINANKDNAITDNEVINKTLLWYQGKDAHGISLGYDSRPDYKNLTGRVVEWAGRLLNGTPAGNRFTDYTGHGADRAAINTLQQEFDQRYHNSGSPQHAAGPQNVAVDDGSTITLAAEFQSAKYQLVSARKLNGQYTLNYKYGDNAVMIVARDKDSGNDGRVTLTGDEIVMKRLIDKRNKSTTILNMQNGGVTAAARTTEGQAPEAYAGKHKISQIMDLDAVFNQEFAAKPAPKPGF